jgi:hypothetical protein
MTTVLLLKLLSLEYSVVVIDDVVIMAFPVELTSLEYRVVCAPGISSLALLELRTFALLTYFDIHWLVMLVMFSVELASLGFIMVYIDIDVIPSLVAFVELSLLFVHAIVVVFSRSLKFVGCQTGHVHGHSTVSLKSSPL